jgi:hypothetical protein
MELDHIAHTGNPQRRRRDAQAANKEQIAAFFRLAPVVGALVHQFALRGPVILAPQMLDMYKRPLTAAKRKMLDAGKLEIVLLGVSAHIMRLTVTPAGTAASSTVTA